MTCGPGIDMGALLGAFTALLLVLQDENIELISRIDENKNTDFIMNC
jgi:hypothetical protein